jgi:hypothetical protein
MELFFTSLLFKISPPSQATILQPALKLIDYSLIVAKPLFETTKLIVSSAPRLADTTASKIV